MPGEAQVSRGAGVPSDEVFEAEIVGCPGGGIDAHMRHHAADDEAVNPVCSELVQQGRLPETVRVVLLDNGFPFKRPDVGVEVNPGRPG